MYEDTTCVLLQVVRIEREAEEVTVFYRPNSLGVEELSRNPVANALAVTFLLSTETVGPTMPLALSGVGSSISAQCGALLVKCDILNVPLFWPQCVLIVQNGGACTEEDCEVRKFGSVGGNGCFSPPIQQCNTAVCS